MHVFPEAAVGRSGWESQKVKIILCYRSEYEANLGYM